MSKIINGINIAQEILMDIPNRVALLKNQYNIIPKIVTVLVGQNQASDLYVKAKLKKASEFGIESQILKLRHQITEEGVIKEIQKLNQDTTITGILVQLPLPEHLNQATITNSIDKNKDIDGLCHYNIGLLNQGSPTAIIPCTPQGILFLLKKFYTDLSSKKAVILGRSAIVGRPISTMLLNADCTVVHLHSKSKNIKNECLQADILIVAVGKPRLVQSDWIKRGSFVIDVGINRKQGKILGDVDFHNVLDKVSYITPVPKGIGPLTVASLISNTVRLCYIQNKSR